MSNPYLCEDLQEDLQKQAIAASRFNPLNWGVMSGLTKKLNPSASRAKVANVPKNVDKMKFYRGSPQHHIGINSGKLPVKGARYSTVPKNVKKMTFSANAPKGYIPQTDLGRNVPAQATRYDKVKRFIGKNKAELGIGATATLIGGAGTHLALNSKRGRE